LTLGIATTHQEEVCSRLVEMSAGTGKTETIARIAHHHSIQGQRTLILTHTNAGIEALGERLKKYGIPPKTYSIWTIASFAFRIASSYQVLGEMSIGENPEWEKSKPYYEAATRVIGYRAIREIIRTNFDLLLVDEYQDCTESQHKLICVLSELFPQSIIFGDPLQGIFDFDKEDQPPSWSDVKKHFIPCHAAGEVLPRRWEGSNKPLGDWLTYELRRSLIDGNQIDLSGVSPEILCWKAYAEDRFQSLAYRALDWPGSTLIIIDQKHREKNIASRLGGKFVILEELQGSFMRKHLKNFPGCTSPMLADWLAGFSKECFCGLAGIDKTVRDKLGANQTIASIAHRAQLRQPITSILLSLDNLRSSPCSGNFADAVEAYKRNHRISLYRREAWNEVCLSVQTAFVEGGDPLELFSKKRSFTSGGKRAGSKNILSRTLLVKGLEYDNVIIENANSLKDARNFYVAMTRAKKHLHVFGSSSLLRFEPEIGNKRNGCSATPNTRTASARSHF
jgi:hypothetical protein